MTGMVTIGASVRTAQLIVMVIVAIVMLIARAAPTGATGRSAATVQAGATIAGTTGSHVCSGPPRRPNPASIRIRHSLLSARLKRRWRSRARSNLSGCVDRGVWHLILHD
jgi:hypothetical protein